MLQSIKKKWIIIIVLQTALIFKKISILESKNEFQIKRKNLSPLLFTSSKNLINRILTNDELNDSKIVEQIKDIKESYSYFNTKFIVDLDEQENEFMRKKKLKYEELDKFNKKNIFYSLKIMEEIEKKRKEYKNLENESNLLAIKNNNLENEIRKKYDNNIFISYLNDLEKNLYKNFEEQFMGEIKNIDNNNVDFLNGTKYEKFFGYIFNKLFKKNEEIFKKWIDQYNNEDNNRKNCYGEEKKDIKDFNDKNVYLKFEKIWYILKRLSCIGLNEFLDLDYKEFFNVLNLVFIQILNLNTINKNNYKNSLLLKINHTDYFNNFYYMYKFDIISFNYNTINEAYKKLYEELLKNYREKYK